MNLRVFFLIGAVFLFGVSCSQTTGQDEQQTATEVRFEDEAKKDDNGEIVFDDANSDGSQPAVATFGANPRAEVKTAADNSKITTRYDGYGNKIETRTFSDHPNIAALVIKTTPDGQQQVIVYGQSGETRRLPEETANQILSASGDEIARATGIYSTRQQLQRGPEVARKMPPPMNRNFPLPQIPQPVAETGSQQTVENQNSEPEEPPQKSESTPAPVEPPQKPAPTVNKLQKEVINLTRKNKAKP